MKIHRSILVLLLSLLSPLQSLAGPCSSQIADMQAHIDSKINDEAAAGREGVEGAAATEHHQPTPKSIAEAEVRLGDITAKYAAAVGQAMERARNADRSGDRSACEADLVLVRPSLGE